MAQFQAYSAGVMVNGQTVLSVVKGMGVFAKTASDILARHGIQNPEPAGWYSQQAWLDAFREIAGSIGARTLKQIGQSIPATAKFPPAINNVESALASIDQAYHMNHRGGEIGHYAFKKTGEGSGVIDCRNPYPCEFDAGLIEAMMRRFVRAGSVPKIIHDSAKPCRSRQGESCTYLVSW